ncbi:MAG: cytochrome c [Nitrospira sp.]|jgi:mono/diheme cytochrome c family protein|nr:cytochrome c [Nitrospira sp.]
MKTLLGVVLVIVLVSAPWVSAQVQRGHPKVGEDVYRQQCLRCHGPNLDGNGPDSRDLIVRPADLRSAIIRSKTDWELLVAISNGVLFSPMHSFRGKLTDEQMLDVLSYIRFISPPDVVS